eukprot:6204331-Pleurochrysis_carterae.AAC.1
MTVCERDAFFIEPGATWVETCIAGLGRTLHRQVGYKRLCIQSGYANHALVQTLHTFTDEDSCSEALTRKSMVSAARPGTSDTEKRLARE